MTTRSKVLIVDDDPGLRKTLSDVLNIKGYGPVTAATGEAALAEVRGEAPAVAVIDLKLEDMPGLEVVREIKERSPDTECIVLTGYASQESAIEAVNLGAYSYVQKPYDMEQLLLTIRRAVEKREAEEEARYQKKYFQALFDGSPEGVVSVDMERRVTDMNPAFERMFGYSLDDMKVKDIDDCILPEEKQREGRGLSRRVFQSELVVTETVRKRADGTEIAVSLLGAPVIVEGRQVGILGIYRDISERKRAEEALRESEGFRSSLLENSPNPILVSNADTSIRYVNPALERLSGFSAAELIGVKAPYPWWTKETMEKTSADFAEAFSKGAQRREQLFQKKSGEQFWVEITAGPITSEGELKHYVGNWVDITEHKKAQERLEDAFIDLTETVSRTMAVRDPFTSGHQRRAAELARLVAEKMGVNGDRLYGLYVGALLHDIGKISVPASILTKPGKLSEQEWAIIRAHCRQGYEILKDTQLPWPVAEMALHHHERLDGSGYPDGISGDALSLELRILGVCDVVEAMSSFRPYRPARSREEVLAELKGGRGTKYDTEVVDRVLELVEEGAFELPGREVAGIGGGLRDGRRQAKLWPRRAVF